MYVPLGLLRRHVAESNAIEGIRDHSGFLVQSHLDTAQLVAREASRHEITHPSRIHRLLARGTPLERFGGMYRNCRMWVGDRECPKPQYVAELMAWLDGLLREYRELEGSKGELGFRAMFAHTVSLCIHPFEDGNGRTARLLLNGLRGYHGLPWLVIEAAARKGYYARIRNVADEFERQFAHMF